MSEIEITEHPYTLSDGYKGTLYYTQIEEHQIEDHPLQWQLAGKSYTASGYGGKIPTTKMIRINKRLYRIYVMIYGNSGTAYILIKGKKVIPQINGASI